MKRFIFFFLFISSMAFAQPEKGIQFQKGTWAEITAQAKSENKLIFVDAFAVWCGPCKWMDKNVFPSEKVGAFFSQNFVSAKIDMEKGEGVDLAKKYSVQAYPTYLFVDTEGQIVHRFTGSMPEEKFMEASGNALNPEKQYGALLRKYEQGQKDPQFIYNLSYAAMEAYDLQKAQELSAIYLKSQTDLTTENNVKYIIDFTRSTEDPGFAVMRDHPGAFETKLGKDKYDARLYDMVLRSAPRATGLQPNPEKSKAAEYIAKASTYFKTNLPSQANKMTGAFSMTVYRTLEDWNNYAKQAISYYDQYPSTSAGELNSVAWTFYEHVTNKPELSKAIAWGLESVRISESYANLDTVASLYHKAGDKAKAKDYALKAIALGKFNNEDTSSTEKLLAEIN